MRKLCLLLATLCLIPNAHAYDREKLFQAFLSVVMTRGYNEDGSLAYGSGVVVAEDKVLTNCHIFRNTKEPWISRGEDSYRILSVQADRYHDLCLITAENLPFPTAKIMADTRMQKGQEIVAIGHSSGSPSPINSVGTIKSIYPYEHGKVVRSNARFAMGASGSGLFTSDGELIGINTFKTPGRNAYFYALPIAWLPDLEKLPVETKFPIEGKTFWEEDDLKKPFFMQMALPEINEDWAKLAEVAERWTKAEPDSTEAWYELGHARESLGKTADAEQAYRKSLALDAANTDAMYRIGVLASQKGNKDEVHAISVALLELNKDIAEQFGNEVGCAQQC